MKHKIGIIGVGMVGGALERYFRSVGIKPFLYDKYKKIGSIKEVNKADLIFIAVPTPCSLNGRGFDLKALKDALNCIQKNKIVVIKSTILPGTTKKLSQLYPELKIFFNPEFLTSNTADYSFRNPYIQIVGFVSEKDKSIARKILSLLPKGKFLNRICPAEIAEAIKIVRNVLSVVTVVAINEIYDILEKAQIKYEKSGKQLSVREGLEALAKLPSYHLQVIHKGGRGAGGHCLPKDLAAFKDFANQIAKRSSSLINLVEKINKKLLKKYPKK